MFLRTSCAFRGRENETPAFFPLTQATRPRTASPLRRNMQTVSGSMTPADSTRAPCSERSRRTTVSARSGNSSTAVRKTRDLGERRLSSVEVIATA